MERVDVPRGGLAMSVVMFSIVTEDGEVRDFEVPAGMQAGEAAGLLGGLRTGSAGMPGSPIAYRLVKLPECMPLDPSMTLAEAGIWDGAILRIEAETAAPASGIREADSGLTTSAAQGAAAHPVTGWRPLDIALPGARRRDVKPSADKGKQTRAFVWKRLD